MMHHYPPIRSASRFFTLLILMLSPLTGFATSVIPMNIETISQQAELIIHASVTGQQVKYDEASKRVVTITHFDVIDTLKGTTGSTHSIKQLGGRLPGQTLIHRVHGIPKFINGEDYIVFLPAVSRLGFSSPIGLAQGNFRINMIAGKAMIRDSRGASSAPAKGVNIQRASKAVPRPSANMIELESFKSDIRELAGD